jgi:heme O synthase-like polyprenyltransferase
MKESPLAVSTGIVTAVNSRRASSLAADYVALTKPRLNFLVLATTAAAYYLGDGASRSLAHLFHTIVGTALVAGGAVGTILVGLAPEIVNTLFEHS